jgi:hypothetical protein
MERLGLFGCVLESHKVAFVPVYGRIDKRLLQPYYSGFLWAGNPPPSEVRVRCVLATDRAFTAKKFESGEEGKG